MGDSVQASVKLYLAWYRQLVVEVLQVADETGWQGPESPVRLEWKRCGGGRVI